MKYLKPLIIGAVFLFAGLTASYALADKPPDTPGNGGLPKGGDNPCGPSEHGVYDQNGNFLRCEHNGDGGGNCGQNQSENGGDKGYGHKGDCTETVPETTTTGTTTQTTTTTPTTTGTTTTTPTTTTTETTTQPPPTTTESTTTQTTTTEPTTTTTPVVPPTVKPPKPPPVTTPALQKQLKKQAEKANPNHVTTAHPQAAGELPNTGLPLGAVVALGLSLVGVGLRLRRTT